MSITRVTETRLFKQLEQDATLIPQIEVDNDDGEIKHSEGAPQAVKVREFPINAETIDRFDAGFFDKQDKVFKTKGKIGSPAAKKIYIIEFGGIRYQIVSIEDRDFEGGFVDYIAKREPDQVSA